MYEHGNKKPSATTDQQMSHKCRLCPTQVSPQSDVVVFTLRIQRLWFLCRWILLKDIKKTEKFPEQISTH